MALLRTRDGHYQDGPETSIGFEFREPRSGTRSGGPQEILETNQHCIKAVWPQGIPVLESVLTPSEKF